MLKNSLIKAIERVNWDVAIAGAGVAGLSAAIRLKQKEPSLQVCVLEKAGEVGAHVLSGCVLEPRALDELIPNWRDLPSPVKTPVTADKVYFLTEKKCIQPPFVPECLNNQGNYIVDLGKLAKWLSIQAEELGVHIFTSFPVSQLLISKQGFLEGVLTAEFGLDSSRSPTKHYQPSVEIKAKQTLFADGCKGNLSEALKTQFNLEEFNDGIRQVSPQSYAVGLKEVWEAKPQHFQSGLVQHTFYWPLDSTTMGGGFMYHEEPNLVHLGMVIALDYSNPYLNPYEEFQKYKLHKVVRKHLEQGNPVSYGAKALSLGGFFSVPKLCFPGGVLLGDSAGFTNVGKMKGAHTAMKSGILAADAVVENKSNLEGKELFEYYEKFRKSWIWEELYTSRDIRDSFRNNIWYGSAYTYFTYDSSSENKFLVSVSQKGESCLDSEATAEAKDSKPPFYPPHDHTLTFDIQSNLLRSQITYNPDQPNHIQVSPEKETLEVFDKIEERLCPGSVFKFENGSLLTYPQNCLHCKVCEIKTPHIKWSPPEGGDGPKFVTS